MHDTRTGELQDHTRKLEKTKARTRNTKKTRKRPQHLQHLQHLGTFRNTRGHPKTPQNSNTRPTHRNTTNTQEPKKTHRTQPTHGTQPTHRTHNQHTQNTQHTIHNSQHSCEMVRFVFPFHNQVSRTICLSISLRASTRVSSDFALFRHCSPPFRVLTLAAQTTREITVGCKCTYSSINFHCACRINTPKTSGSAAKMCIVCIVCVV